MDSGGFRPGRRLRLLRAAAPDARPATRTPWQAPSACRGPGRPASASAGDRAAVFVSVAAMDVNQFFVELERTVDPARIAGIDHSYLFEITGEGRWLVEVRDGTLTVTRDPAGGADVEFTTSPETFERLASGKQNPMMAYMTGKLKVDGDLQAALELQKIF